MNVQRREFIALLSLCAASPTLAAGYVPQALTQSEYALLDDLAETLLPRDETGPGARDAHVAYYLDIVLKHSSPARAQLWKNGLNGIDRRAGLHEIMAELTKNELAPQSERDRFFVDFKNLAIDAFYASELIQREHLGYKGDTAIAEFPGCTHPDFEHPDV